MNVLLMGIGRWGMNHLRLLRSLPVELFVCDPDAARLQAARELGLADSRLATDAAPFAAQADAVVIVTPAPTHFPLCRQFLEAGQDVFVEKPLTLRRQEARELAELADQARRILQVGHVFRFEPASQWLREALRAGQFGRVHIMRGHFGGFRRPRNDSGALFADGIHFVDLFNYLLDALPRSVQAIDHDFLGRGVEDVSWVSLEYETRLGTTWATVQSDCHVPGKFREVIVVGEKLGARCDFTAPRHQIVLHENRHVRDGAGFKAVEGAVTPVECPRQEPLLAELRAFLECVQTRRPPLADGWAGYHAVRVVEAALASAKTGRKIRLK